MDDVPKLDDVANYEEPQIALAAFTRELCRRWTYTQRKIPDIGTNFKPLEDTIHNILIPAIIGRPVNTLERRLLALPVRFGGLGLQDPSNASQMEYLSSIRITEELTSLIYNQNMSILDLDHDNRGVCYFVEIVIVIRSPPKKVHLGLLQPKTNLKLGCEHF